MLESTFEQLVKTLRHAAPVVGIAADPFFTFVHAPAETLDVHQRIPRWRGTLEREGFAVKIVSLGTLMWEIVDDSGRWDDWLEAEDRRAPAQTIRSMRDVLIREDSPKGLLGGARPGLFARLRRELEHEAPKRLVLLTDAALLHPWCQPDKLGNDLHDKIRCPTVLFYPGKHREPFGLRFLAVHPEDVSGYRTTILRSAS